MTHPYRKRTYLCTIFVEKWKLPSNPTLPRTGQWVYTQFLNLHGRVKIAALKFITSFSDETVNKRIYFSSLWFNKNDKNARILPFIQLHLFIENEPKVVKFIARWAVCFVHPKWWKVECPTVRFHKLQKYNPYHYNSRNCSFSKHFLLKYFVQLLCERPYFNVTRTIIGTF